MKDFTRGSGRLHSLPFPARVVYTVFLAFTLAALALTAWLGEQMVGAKLERTREYYTGAAPSAAPASAAAKPEGGGPQLDIPDAALASPPPEPMALRKLLEVTHFHLFSMPVYLLILSHLFMLSRWSSRGKVFWIVVSTLAVALHIAAPWIARADWAGSTFVYGLSGTLLALGFGVMSLVPLFEMWRTPPSAASVPPPAQK
jgi:hypothetical protein